MKLYNLFLPILCCLSYSPTTAQKIVDVEWEATIKELPILNSKYRETNPALSPDNQELYFLSTRGQMPWSKMRKNSIRFSGYDGDIWKSDLKNNVWSKPYNLKSLNNNQGQDEPVIIGEYIYYEDWAKGWTKAGGPYYKGNLHTSKKTGLGGGITEFFIKTGYRATDGASYSLDGQTMIFASGAYYDANMDFYISHKVNQ